MRTSFIDYKEAPTLSDAEALAPWACAVVEVDGGWMAYESATDAEIWERQE